MPVTERLRGSEPQFVAFCHAQPAEPAPNAVVAVYKQLKFH